MRLERGQVAVITGAANGIGRALAHATADRGMKLVLARQSLDAIEAGHLHILIHDQIADPLRERTHRIIGG